MRAGFGTILSVAAVLLPPLCVYLKASLPLTLALVALLSFSTWLGRLSALAPQSKKKPTLVLETFAVRWSMDRLGVDYHEEMGPAMIGIWFFGQSIPRLKICKGMSSSVLGNSSDILRYLYGRYGGDEEYKEKAAFLMPTPEALAMEKKVDKYGHALQQFLYYYALDHPRQAIGAWGLHDNIPFYFKVVLVVCYPLFAFFMRAIFPRNAKAQSKALAVIHDVCDELELVLGKQEKEGKKKKTVLETPDYTFCDLQFACMTGMLFCQRINYAGGCHPGIAEDTLPRDFLEAMHEVRERYPVIRKWVEEMYLNERMMGRESTT